jgi:hypothetical protein
MAISYTPQFSHKDWIDFVDSVQAGGTNGINIRFHGIETEFAAISSAIAQIAQVLATPTVTSHTLTLAPTLAATTQQPWQQQVGFVVTATLGSSAAQTMSATAGGFMPVSLPNGATIQGLRVTGQSAGGVLTVALQSQPLTGAGAPTTLLQIFDNFPSVAAAVAFDLPPAPQNASIAVDTVNNKYFITATLQGGNAAVSAGGTSLNVFQITYSST